MNDIFHVQLLPYQSSWMEKFQVEKTKIQNIFGDLAISIEHIGSTSIDGLLSKPIIDIAVLLENKLKERGCALFAPIRQRDIVYSKRGAEEFESSKEGDVIIRIRYLDNGAEFNLKQQRSGEMDNIEYETEVKDPSAIHQILLILGYAPEVEIKKTRRKGKLENCEICLDEVDGLGSFVEIEKLTDDDADPNKVRDELFKVAESLDLSRKNEETRGYDTQIYQLRKK